MKLFETLAQRAVDCWEKGDLAAVIREMDAALKETQADRLAHEETIRTACEMYCEDESGIEIDPEPPLSIGEEGVWVGAWVWVPIETQPEGQAG